VHLQRRAERPRPLDARLDELVRAVEDRAEGVREAEAAVRGSLPAPRELVLDRQRVLCGLAPRLWHALGLVHRAPAEKAPDACPLEPATRAVDVLPPGIGDRGHAVPDLLEGAGERTHLYVLLVEGGLIRPDAVAKPREEVDVVGQPAPELLAQMAVRVDETRDDDEPAS